MRLIVGLGNPGRRYAHSRHNVGFDCVDHMAREWDIRLSERRAKAVLGRGIVSAVDVVLARPRTYMNVSGEGVRYLLQRFGAKPGDLLVVHDDMDLPLGRIRVRYGGSDAGHNGIKSIIAELSTQDFPRVRVGISKPPEGVEGMDYVLGAFSGPEVPVIHKAVMAVAEAVTCVIEEGIEEAMNRFNRAPSAADGP